MNPSPTNVSPSYSGSMSGNSYDAKGRVATATDCLSYPGGVCTGNTSTVEYNADGTVAKAYSPAWPTSNPTLYGYTNHQLTSVDPPGTDLGSTSATYDGFGRLRTSTSGQNMTTTFTYDLLDRVKIEAHSDPTIPTITYDYDPAGNLLSRNDAGGTTIYTYDQANRPLTKTGGLSWSWYPAGNLKTATDLGGPTTYLYDNPQPAAPGERAHRSQDALRLRHLRAAHRHLVQHRLRHRLPSQRRHRPFQLRRPHEGDV